MKKVLTVVFAFFCLVNASGLSLRVKALGSDFANLIPDYETDLYRNPQSLSTNIVGIAYDPFVVYDFFRFYAPMIVHQAPIALTVTTRGFGMTGKYWMNYSHELEPYENTWESFTTQEYRIEDLWMFRVGEVVLNIYNDLDYSKINNTNAANSRFIDKNFEYIVKTQYSHQIKKRLNLDLKLGLGFYNNKWETDFYTIYDQCINIALARLGLYCRNISSVNDFTSWYLDIGSPISNAEIDSLPFSVYSALLDDETAFMWFAKTLVARLGFAKALPIANRGFLAIGVKNALLFQNTETASEELNLRGIENTLSVPIAAEYIVNTVSLRFGASFSYHFQNLRQAENNSVYTHDIVHGLDYGYSFGLGWQPHKKFAIDIYNNAYFWHVKDWAIYVKYLF